jgi:type I restriction enzyme S subunit
MGKKIVYKIKDISQIYSGGDKPDAFSEEKTEEFSVPVYSNGLDNEGLYGYTNKSQIEGDCITVSARGVNIGTVFYRKEPFLPIVRLLSIIPDRTIIDAKYLYYYFKTDKIIGTGSAQPQLTIPFFSKKKIYVYKDLSTQQKIASILSTYDNLIQNYKKQIEDLQTCASELYKEWFVRFRFPGYQNIKMKNSNIGKIPNTFEVKKQNEVINDYIGGGWGEDEQSSNFPIEAAVVRGADFPNFTNGDISSCPIRYHKTSNYNSRIIEPDDIVLEVSGGTQEQPVGRTVIVSEERLKRFDNKLICASFCKLIRLNKSIISPFFYYYWMQFVYETRIIDRYQLQSTGIINFKFEYFLRKGDVLLPPKELMESFDSKVRIIHSKIEKLAMSIENLTKQRDLLLPRLMSGKLEVI